MNTKKFWEFHLLQFSHYQCLVPNVLADDEEEFLEIEEVKEVIDRLRWHIPNAQVF